MSYDTLFSTPTMSAAKRLRSMFEQKSKIHAYETMLAIVAIMQRRHVTEAYWYEKLDDAVVAALQKEGFDVVSTPGKEEVFSCTPDKEAFTLDTCSCNRYSYWKISVGCLPLWDCEAMRLQEDVTAWEAATEKLSAQEMIALMEKECELSMEVAGRISSATKEKLEYEEFIVTEGTQGRKCCSCCKHDDCDCAAVYWTTVSVDMAT